MMVRKAIIPKIFIYILILNFSVQITASAQAFKVVIDAGHGGKDPGAMGSVAKEKDINLAVALQLGNLIKDRHPDVKVIYTRDDDYFVELQERANIANRSKAHLFISIHTNASKSREARGTETYTLGLRRSNENLEVAKRENSVILLEDNYRVKYEGFDPNSTESYIMFELIHDAFIDQSINMASTIQKEFRSSDCIDRGVRQDVFLVLRNTGMPSVLIELGYISNRAEEEFLLSESGQRKLSSSIYNAFARFKRNYDNRQGTLSQAPRSTTDSSLSAKNKESQPEEAIIKARPVKKEKENEKEESKSAVQDVESFRVQLLISNVKLKPGSSKFKGIEPVDYFEENGLYKYTYGNTTDEKEIKKLRKELSKKFKDCFIVVFKDNKKIGIR